MDCLKSRFIHLLPVTVGAFPLMGAVLWYQIGMLAKPQIGWLRVLGLLGTCWLVTSVIAGVLTLLAVAFRIDQRLGSWRYVARGLYFTSGLASLAALGLTIFYWSPSLAPTSAKAMAGLGVAALCIGFWRYQEEEQRLLVRLLGWLGITALVPPLVVSPWVCYGALSSRVEPLRSPQLPGTSVTRPDAPTRIVLVTFDGMRAWSTSLHEPQLGTTPTLEKLARQSTWFSQARASTDTTLFSMASMLSGQPPERFLPHVRNVVNLLPHGLLTGLPTYLKAAGYRSRYATMYLSPRRIGLGRDFDRGAFNSHYFIISSFHSTSYLPLKETFHFLASKVVRQDGVNETRDAGLNQVLGVRKTFDQALEMLDDEPSQRAFVWAHLGAPHIPYYQVPELKPSAVLDPKSYSKVTEHDLNEATRTGDPEQLRRIRAAYHAYTAFADRELGRFVQGLKDADLWNDTMLIVTADHGENLMPGMFTHGIGPVSGAQSHVPLLIRLPGQTQAERVDQVVSHLDVVPTILAQVYTETPPDFEGRSILGASIPDDRLVTTQGWLFGRPMSPLTSALYRGRYMYLDSLVGGDEYLFDLVADPNERHNIAKLQPLVTSDFRALAQQKREQFGPAPAKLPEWTNPYRPDAAFR